MVQQISWPWPGWGLSLQLAPSRTEAQLGTQAPASEQLQYWVAAGRIEEVFKLEWLHHATSCYIMLHHATSTESDIPTVESFNFHILGFLILWPSCGSEDAAPVQGASQGAVHPASLFWSGVMSKIQTHLQNTKENWQEYVRSRNTKK